jgi:hypothetical protein
LLPGCCSLNYMTTPTLSEMAGAVGLPAVAYIHAVSAGLPTRSDDHARGERAAVLAGSYCTRRLGRVYAQAGWQMLADASRLGVIRHGRPEAWAAGAVVALARFSGVLGAEGALTAQQVADDLDVTLGTLTVTERELSRALNLAPSAHRVRAAAGKSG